MRNLSSITNKPIRVGEVLDSVRDDSAGGTVLFVGTIRNRSHGNAVTGLKYDVYKEMAEKKMAEIGEQVKERWPVKKIAMVHRYGDLEVGEVSVAVAVACEHRGDAFQACRYAINTIKGSLPLWKKEKLRGGVETWVRGRTIQH